MTEYIVITRYVVVERHVIRSNEAPGSAAFERDALEAIRKLGGAVSDMRTRKFDEQKGDREFVGAVDIGMVEL